MAAIAIRGAAHAYDLTPPRPSELVLVFIHGWLLSRQYWHPLIAQLEPQYQCLAYDLRGFGDSQSSPAGENADYSLQVYARDLQELLQRLEIERAWLIGHSLGGSIALWSAACCPQVMGAICLNAGGGIYIQEAFERFRTAGRRLVKWRPRWLHRMPGIDWVFARSMVGQPLARQWGYQRALDFTRADANAALGSLLNSTTEAEVHRLPQLVAQLKQPVYFIAGQQDRVMEPRYVRHLASFHRLFRAEGSNVTELADCGHMAMVERPGAIAQLIDGILAAAQPMA
ncbi:MAG: alpha/beta hydrolase [Cyanobacteria bacterium QS_8_64_29]|nr:MAG: alpha/beta hydrolase [Cyanobacteria bacterium QS_8_64_29]